MFTNKTVTKHLTDRPLPFKIKFKCPLPAVSAVCDDLRRDGLTDAEIEEVKFRCSESFYAGTNKPEALLKRFLFVLDSGTLTRDMKGEIIDKAHCAMYLMSTNKIMGFIHLKIHRTY